MRGLVIKSTGNAYLVRLDDGSDVECHIKGNFRIRGIRSTNPVAVGDWVEVKEDVKSQTGPEPLRWITEIEERRNYIIRRSTNLSKESHILAANIDQVALLVTINHPETSTTFIDRFLATCEAYRVPAILVFNKIDLLTESELQHMAELRSLYESLGYQTLAISAKELGNTEYRVQSTDLFSILEGKTTLLSGNSGVGKSTLLNALFGREITRTGKISDAHDKGMHTTTFSEMFFLSIPPETDASEAISGSENGQPRELNAACGSQCDRVLQVIDTPGIKGFGSINMEKEEVSHYFREIFRIGADCRFGNCSHTNEPGCAVIQAVEQSATGDIQPGDDNYIALSRYESYLSILGDCGESKYR